MTDAALPAPRPEADDVVRPVDATGEPEAG
jgi:hypothetical protein